MAVCIESDEVFDALLVAKGRDGSGGTSGGSIGARPSVVQFGSKVCKRCPEFTARITELGSQYQFEWYYVDAHESELPERFAITKLPALVLLEQTTQPEPIVVQDATLDALTSIVAAHCPPVLILNEDF